MVGGAGHSRTWGGSISGVLVNTDGPTGAAEEDEEGQGCWLFTIGDYCWLICVWPLKTLQLIQGEVKDVGHVMVGRPAAGQLVLQTEDNCWCLIDQQVCLGENREKCLTVGMASSKSHFDFLFFLSAAALNTNTFLLIICSTEAHLTCQSKCHLPVSGQALLTPPPPIVLSTLRKKLGGGVGGNSDPQTKDALPLLYLLPT